MYSQTEKLKLVIIIIKTNSSILQFTIVKRNANTICVAPDLGETPTIVLFVVLRDN